MPATLAVVAVLVVVLVTSCGGSPSVPWQNYAPEVKARIEAAVAAKDCESLQRDFDAAYASNENIRRRTGTGNAALMEYLDHGMREAKCYR